MSGWDKCSILSGNREHKDLANPHGAYLGLEQPREQTWLALLRLFL